ncbi:hypothetical protein GCM10010965_22240 [Caldalkalibacillus thermarum]|uniref:cell wall-binding repeat-containing protein n=1 Tax=Caldalkalibacillus thermarum TaxID=296745 RepID=UPI00166D32D5|nr:cell wall-binding repeat-containing protein [Caldalkalibacillus thermarum]GGK28953.1 hypothetical protein GCM10010965_22240 [Caldalkalibacillus thermarum]
MSSFFRLPMKRWLILLLAIALAGTAWPPATAASSPSSINVQAAKEMLPAENGEWQLLAREGTLTVPVKPGATALEVVLPKNGPAVTAPAGWKTEVKQVTNKQVILHLVPESASVQGTVQLTFTALPQETEDPRVLSLSWVGGGEETSETSLSVSQYAPASTGTAPAPVYISDSKMTLRPLNDGHIEVRGPSATRKYAGHILIEESGGKISLTNRVRLDLYLQGVVPREMPASFGVEALKAQAVAARTYAQRLDFGSKPDRRLLDTQAHQVYGGIYDDPTWSPRVKNAVSSTDGRTLMYAGNLAATLYSSANGGMIEASAYAFSTGQGTQYPYMQARPDRYLYNGNNVIPETYGQRTANGFRPPANVYEWTVTLNARDIEQQWPQIGQFQNIRITQRTPGNGANWIEISGSKGKVNVSGHQFRSAFGTMVIRSTQFDLKVNATKSQVTVNGKGFGHRTGMSQWGAQGLSNLGANYQQILSHYYPGTTLSKRYSDTEKTVHVRLFGGTARNSWLITAPEGAELLDSSGKRVRTLSKGQLYELKPANVERIKGDNRYGTAAAISSNWKQADTVIIARGDDYADALAGVPLAHKLNAPILLTGSNNLPPETRQELERLKPAQVILLGKTKAISEDVKSAIEKINPGSEVTRIGGDNRYDTARLIAAHVAPEGVSAAVIVNGQDFPDAISVAPFAGRNGYPILLVTRDQIPLETQEALEQLQPGNTYVIGGPAAIDEGLLPEAKRLYGSNRFETNLDVLKHFKATGQPLYVATGLDYADALTGAVLAAKQNRGILLVSRTVPPKTEAYFKQHGLPPFTVFGGQSAVSDQVAYQLLHLLK